MGPQGAVKLFIKTLKRVFKVSQSESYLQLELSLLYALPLPLLSAQFHPPARRHRPHAATASPAQGEQMARLSLVVALVGAADAFQAGASLNSRRSVVSRSKMNMQVGEAVVAQPTALAKVQGCRDSGVPRARARPRRWAQGH